MTRSLRTAILLIFLAAAVGLAEVVVLKGGVVVHLQRPPVRRGNNVLLTRMDGTLLSVPASEIDVAATAAARAVPPPAPEPPPARPPTLVEAARASHEVPKARVRITDSDVSHGERAAQAGNAEEAQKEKETGVGAGSVEVADYTQEKSGEALIVRGTLRNPGATTAISIRMTVTALDAKGHAIASGDAGLSSVVIEPTKTAAFSITIPVGTKQVASLKFTPHWVAPAAPSSGPGSEEPASKNAPPAAAPAAAAAPQPTAPPPPPAPTPYGRGSLYAPPAPNAPSEAPKDGKTGYIPGASSPSNQPKPPG